MRGVRDWIDDLRGRRVQPAAELIIGLLELGDGWRRTSHHLTHDAARVSIWIANQWYGFAVRIDGGSAFPQGQEPNAVQFDKYSRRKLIAAVKSFLSGADGTDIQVRQLAQRIIDLHPNDAPPANVVPIRGRA